MAVKDLAVKDLAVIDLSSTAGMVLRAAANRRMPMAFEPGDVVFLKSGGQPMTVAAVEEDSIDCIWVGEEGELFRETIPSIALTAAPADEEELGDEADESDDDDKDHEDADREDVDEEEVKPAKGRRKTA
jgi:uncharacterized protein YodC (DUF2158 family)